MYEPEEILSLFESERERLGLSQAEVGARAFGKSDNTAFQNMRRGSAPRFDKVAALAEALGLELYLGPRRIQVPEELLEKLSGVISISPDETGRGPDFVAHRDDGSTIDIDLKTWTGQGRRAMTPPTELSEFAKIPVHAATLAAGGGAHNGEEPVVDHLAFKRAWLSRIGISPANAVLARVAHGELGESMMPTICPGDMVLIDTSKREIPRRPPDYKSRKGPIYAFTTEEGARVKRLAQLSDVIILVSDNPDVPPEFLSKDRWSEVNVIGKVVWWGHTAEE
ncbi:MAG: hypothetical protein GYB51_16075 [Rhodobacteraceae bacterium]|nr:hypothetical protein [Paracoccaceae bacterium]